MVRYSVHLEPRFPMHHEYLVCVSRVKYAIYILPGSGFRVCVRMKQLIPKRKTRFQETCIDSYDAISWKRAWLFVYFPVSFSPFVVSDSQCGNTVHRLKLQMGFKVSCFCTGT